MKNFFQKVKRRHVKEIPLAPVLDLLTVVIFFLVLTTSFVTLRQNEIPPSVTAIAENVANAANDKRPLLPKLLIGLHDSKLKVMLKWGGDNPGQDIREQDLTDALTSSQYNENVATVSAELVKAFLTQYPQEKTLQLGFASRVNFQTVMTAIDGILPVTSDIALISNAEADTLLASSGVKPENQ